MAKPIHPGTRLTPAMAERLGRIFLAERQRRGLRKGQCHPQLSTFEVGTIEKARLRYMTDVKADTVAEFLHIQPGLLPILLDHPKSRISLGPPGLTACHVVPIQPLYRRQLAERLHRHKAHAQLTNDALARGIGIGASLLRDIFRQDRPTLRGDTVAKLAQALGVNEAMMLRWLGVKPEEFLDPDPKGAAG